MNYEELLGKVPHSLRGKIEAYEYMEEFMGDMYHDVRMVHEAVTDYDDGDGGQLYIGQANGGTETL